MGVGGDANQPGLSDLGAGSGAAPRPGLAGKPGPVFAGGREASSSPVMRFISGEFAVRAVVTETPVTLIVPNPPVRV